MGGGGFFRGEEEGIVPEVASATALPRRWLGYNSGG